jgi:hypothetical protein
MVFIFWSFAANSQEFKNQGEQENAWTKTFFLDKYEKQTFELFKGTIKKIDESHIQYDNIILELNITNAVFKTIFTRGIFYPQILIGNVDPNEIVGNGNFRISNFTEVNNVNNSPTSRRFKFWLFTKGMANPKVFFIELTNELATENTNLETFISNSKLTFAKGGWMII